MSVKSYLSSNNTLRTSWQLTSSEVNLFLKSPNTKKAPGTDKIPTKLVTLETNFLSTLLAIAINNTLASTKFSDIAKIAIAAPIAKK